MAGHRSEPPPLPAPYRSPWSRLREDLAAVLADLALALRRILRRNRQGELPCPPLWPRPLAAFFWPMLILLVVALIGVASLALLHRHPGGQPPAALEAPSAAVPAAPEAPAAAATVADVPGAGETTAPPDVSPALTAPIAATAGFGPEALTGSDAEVAAAADPLTLLLQAPEAAGLLLQASADPAHSQLRFTVEAGFATLAGTAQQQQADRWLQWARELGYERLELRDGRGRLLAREALVGDGMILLTSRSSP